MHHFSLIPAMVSFSSIVFFCLLPPALLAPVCDGSSCSTSSDRGPWTRSRDKCSISWAKRLNSLPAHDRREFLELLESMSVDDFTAHYHIERGDCPPLSRAACGSFEEWLESENHFRKRFVRAAFKHVWDNYEKHAWGFDELLPLSGQGTDYLGGFGCLILDSLDTLWLMGFKDQFFRARDWVRDHLDFHKDTNVSMYSIVWNNNFILISLRCTHRVFIYCRRNRAFIHIFNSFRVFIDRRESRSFINMSSIIRAATFREFFEVFHISILFARFESAIRLLGGLLGAFTLHPDPVFLQKAIDLGDRLLRTFK